MRTNRNQNVSGAAAADQPTQPGQTASAPTADPERLATLVADGEVEWPADLTEHEAAQLTVAVRRGRRQRLVALIAQLIAVDIADVYLAAVDHDSTQV
ncbi:MAG: hypothetical protein IID40_05155 [Planctomycetes bacterium]|nr:hypothetical protein [Planctomycetota bacterium]